MSTRRYEAGIAMLDALDPGAEHSQTDIEHAACLVEAMQIFRERNDKYGDLWKEGGAADSAFHLKSKSMRAVILLSKQAQRGGHNPEELEAQVDTGLDLVNYALFYVRNVRAGRVGG